MAGATFVGSRCKFGVLLGEAEIALRPPPTPPYVRVPENSLKLLLLLAELQTCSYVGP